VFWDPGSDLLVVVALASFFTPHLILCERYSMSEALFSLLSGGRGMAIAWFSFLLRVVSVWTFGSHVLLPHRDGALALFLLAVRQRT